MMKTFTFSGTFTIKNKESGKVLHLTKDSLVSASEACGVTDTFIWEPKSGGYGAIKSVISNYVLATSPNWWQKGAYLTTEDQTSEFQKWRVYKDLLVSMKTISYEPAVLSHDPVTNELLVERMICHKEDLHWEFVSQEITSSSGKAPSGDIFARVKFAFKGR